MKQITIHWYDIQTHVHIRELLHKKAVSMQGIAIMEGKALLRVLGLEGISATQGNIIKQEMLSLGADAALSWEAVYGGKKQYPCILMGTDAQLVELTKKLAKQRLGLGQIGIRIKEALQNLQQEKIIVPLARTKLVLGRKTCLMAIVNRTPDSFSEEGIYYDEGSCLRRVEECIRQGADIIDIGGESRRPGARPVLAKEELRRVVPIVRRICRTFRIPVSVDTRKAVVAQACLEEGAQIINDTASLGDPRMGKIIARYKAGCILMHAQGTPQTMQKNPQYQSVVEEVIDSLGIAIDKARAQGIAQEKIIVDPGIGFGKNRMHNLMLLQSIKELRILGRPILLGTSRKSFIGDILHAPVEARMWGTAATVAYGIAQGVHIMRVHDVEEMRQVVRVADAIRYADLRRS